MYTHEEVLAAARRLCAGRTEPTFTPDEIVRALPHLRKQTIRTHVTSRCCVNAPAHHQTRLPYFRRVGRARYELLAAYRVKPALRGARRVRGGGERRPTSDTIHAVVTKDAGIYVVSCFEIAVVTQGRTLDEALANLTEAVALHLEGEDLVALALDHVKRIQILYELPADVPAA